MSTDLTVTHNDGNGNITCTDGVGNDYTLQVSDSSVFPTPNGVSSGHITFTIPPGLTTEEEQELEELKKEKETWTRQQQLIEYGKLHHDLREEILNEALTKEAYERMESVDKTKFDGNDRIKELEAKKPIGVSISSGIHFDLFSPSRTWRFGPILDKFTADELKEAHGQATLEEQLDQNE